MEHRACNVPVAEYTEGLLSFFAAVTLPGEVPSCRGNDGTDYGQAEAIEKVRKQFHFRFVHRLVFKGTLSTECKSND